MKKRDGYKLCTKSCVKSNFDRFFMLHLRYSKILAIPNILAHGKLFKILAIPNVLAHGKLYKNDFMKKYNGHKLCVKSSFDQFFRHR
ncbi:hypothetical protein BHE74_00023670 [Ensete ventricosum]|nr:hypothetical protein BHE74_00023670 [Ensete ventricosum]